MLQQYNFARALGENGEVGNTDLRIAGPGGTYNGFEETVAEQRRPTIPKEHKLDSRKLSPGLGGR